MNFNYIATQFVNGFLFGGGMITAALIARALGWGVC